MAADEAAMPYPTNNAGAAHFSGAAKGIALQPQQAALFDTLLPRLALDLDDARAADLRDAVPEPVERGAPRDRLRRRRAHDRGGRAHPRTGFIGVEPFVNGMAKALAAIDGAGARAISGCTSATRSILLDWLPPDSIARARSDLSRSRGRSAGTGSGASCRTRRVAAIARVLRPGGEFRFATDWPDYAAWTLQHLLRSPAFEWTAERADDWRQPWPGFTSTRYEAKAKREGRVPCYLIFRRDDETCSSRSDNGCTFPGSALTRRSPACAPARTASPAARCRATGARNSQNAVSRPWLDGLAAGARHDDRRARSASPSRPPCTGSGSGRADRRPSADPRPRSDTAQRQRQRGDRLLVTGCPWRIPRPAAR